MKVLLAEDNELLRKSLVYFLGNNGFEVCEYDNGLDALKDLKALSFDIIITDVNMPHIGGMEIINTVRNELQRDTPIIVLTSSGLEKIELDAFSNGANEFVSKPFSPAVLKARIDKLLRQKKNQA